MVIAIIIILVVLAILGIYAFLLMPRISDKADMELLLSDYAHRGLWNETYPENSLAAFALAAEAGVGIELDIQLSKDNHIMVFHDYGLKRMCGIDRKLCDMTYEELKNVRLKESNQCIPTLAEVLKVVDGRIPLLIELKGENLNTELCRRAAAMLDKYHGAFCVESFNPVMLCWFKKFRPRYARGQLVTKVKRKTGTGNLVINFALSHLLLDFLSRPDFIAVDGRIKKRPMIFICEKIFKADVFVWTVRNKKDYDACAGEMRHSIFEGFKP